MRDGGEQLRVVIAEDSVILRDGLVRLLTDRGHLVVAEATNGDELREAVMGHRPDVAVVDVRMPPTHTDEGLRAAIALRDDDPRVRILVFSQYVETRSARLLLAHGAEGVGYLLKDRVAEVGEFLEALARVAAGGTVLDPEVVSQLVRADHHSSSVSALTAREREVLALMAEGRSNAGIARALFVSEGAIEKYVTAIFAKLDLPPYPDDHRRVLAVLRYLDI